MSASIGEKLLGEIERVSAKRERWRGYAANPKFPANAMAFQPGIFLMTGAIDAAKSALASGDGIACVAAMKGLEEFNSND